MLAPSIHYHAGYINIDWLWYFFKGTKTVNEQHFAGKRAKCSWDFFSSSTPCPISLPNQYWIFCHHLGTLRMWREEEWGKGAKRKSYGSHSQWIKNNPSERGIKHLPFSVPSPTLYPQWLSPVVSCLQPSLSFPIASRSIVTYAKRIFSPHLGAICIIYSRCWFGFFIFIFKIKPASRESCQYSQTTQVILQLICITHPINSSLILCVCVRLTIKVTVYQTRVIMAKLLGRTKHRFVVGAINIPAQLNDTLALPIKIICKVSSTNPWCVYLLLELSFVCLMVETVSLITAQEKKFIRCPLFFPLGAVMHEKRILCKPISAEQLSLKFTLPLPSTQMQGFGSCLASLQAKLWPPPPILQTKTVQALSLFTQVGVGSKQALTH